MPSLLRPEILAAEPERGDHLLVYGRISEASDRRPRGQRRPEPCLRGARWADGGRAGRLAELPTVRQRGLHRRSPHGPGGRRLGGLLADERGRLPAQAHARSAARGSVRAGDERALPRAPRLRHGGSTPSTRPRSSASSYARTEHEQRARRLRAGREHRGARRRSTGSWRSSRRAARVSELELGRTLLLFVWAFGLAAIEIEIEGGCGLGGAAAHVVARAGDGGPGVRRRHGPPASHRLPRLCVRDPAASYSTSRSSWGSSGRSPGSCARWRRSSRSRSCGTTCGSSSTPRTRSGASSAGRSGGSRCRGSGASPSTTTWASRVSLGLAGLSAWAAGDVEPLRRHLWMIAGLARARRAERSRRAALPPLVPAHAPPRRRRPRRRANLSAAGAGRGLGGRRTRPAAARRRRETRDEDDGRSPLGAAAGAAGWGDLQRPSPRRRRASASPSSARPGRGSCSRSRSTTGRTPPGRRSSWRSWTEHGVKATFFSIGHYAREQPSLLREVAAAGHAIGNHTYTHVTMPLHTDDDDPP